MTLLLLRDSEHPRRRWRNGGGVTAEVACSPAGGDAHTAFDWRVSFAEVAEDGDFSLFPGVDRIIVLMDGPPMRLRLPEADLEMRRFVPFSFDGGVPVRSELAGPTRDLNVMTTRGRASASIAVLDRPHPGTWVTPSPSGRTVIAVLSGVGQVRQFDAHVRLLPGDVVITEASAEVDGTGHVAVVSIVDLTETGRRAAG